MSDAVAIRPEAPGDESAIDALLRAAFGGAWEADLVRRLREAGAMPLSLVAASAGGEIVGHVAFSPLPIATPTGDVMAWALAPLAVRPDRQRTGVGGALVREGIAEARDAGTPLVVVLGDPAYYGRFGFRAEAAAGLRCPFAGEALQALPLAAAGGSVVGEAVYDPAFFAE